MSRRNTNLRPKVGEQEITRPTFIDSLLSTQPCSVEQCPGGEHISVATAVRLRSTGAHKAVAWFHQATLKKEQTRDRGLTEHPRPVTETRVHVTSRVIIHQFRTLYWHAAYLVLCPPSHADWQWAYQPSWPDKIEDRCTCTTPYPYAIHTST